jgi:hypothetical protein
VFRDEHSWQDCGDAVLRRATLLVCGGHDGERERFFREQWSARAPATPRLIVDFQDLERCKIVSQREGNDVEERGSIRALVRKALKERALIRSVVLDITSLQHAATMFIVKVLMDLVPGEFFAVYAEPARYGNLSSTEFRLTSGFLGNKPVPGFARQMRSSQGAMVAFLGFDGERIERILEDREQIKRVIPVLGVPSYRPGWNLHSLASAARVATSYQALEHMRSCPAYSVHEAVVLLESVLDEEEGQLMVAPLGTRPHTLATAIFASRTKRATIAYDHPIEDPSRSTGVGELHLYHLSGHLR